MKKFTSNAKWPENKYTKLLAFDNYITSDKHETAEQAQAVCEALEKDGLGGEGNVYPSETYVRPITTVAMVGIPNDRGLHVVCSANDKNTINHVIVGDKPMLDTDHSWPPEETDEPTEYGQSEHNTMNRAQRRAAKKGKRSTNNKYVFAGAKTKRASRTAKTHRQRPKQ